MQRWFVLTAYRNMPSPYPEVSSSPDPYGAPFLKKGVVKKIKFKTAAKS